MEDNTKFYIFDKKEIALIFAFMLLVALVAFVLGVKFGLGYSYESSGLTQQDKQQIDLLSTKEEQVNKLLKKRVVPVKNDEQKAMQMREHSVKSLKEEFERLDEKPVIDEDTSESSIEESVESPKSEAVQVEDPSDLYGGKYTIRLASFRSIDDAKEFAGGFKSRGYNTIISDKNIPSKGGLWFRVSIGTFNSNAEAKRYIKENPSLFATQDYQISTFD